MAINRRRAPSSQISSFKKQEGHRNEEIYANLIAGKVITGTGKTDVVDNGGRKHSVKSGKKWQIFLYGQERISNSKFLKILEPCLKAFPEDSGDYFNDRVRCIEFKESYLKKYGKVKAKTLTNSELSEILGSNSYMLSKESLASANAKVCKSLAGKETLRDFLEEAIFNSGEVDFLSIKDETMSRDNRFKVFSKKDVLDALSEKLVPEMSKAGNVVVDFNVAQQKTLLRYLRSDGNFKNVVEIEIRNDSPTHYRQVRFNMYSKDVLAILFGYLEGRKIDKKNDQTWIYGSAVTHL